jgi:hypothetical protein
VRVTAKLIDVQTGAATTVNSRILCLVLIDRFRCRATMEAIESGTGGSGAGPRWVAGPSDGPSTRPRTVRVLAALGAGGTEDVFHGRLLFLDGEVRLVKNLTDLNHVAFVGGAPLRPFHELFF